MRPGVRLALDLGAVRIGVARSDALGLLASPYAVWQTESEWVQELKLTCTEFSVLEVLVGLPLDLRGEEAQAAQSVRQIVESLAEGLPDIPFRLVDERLTTVAARRRLQESGHTTRTDKVLVDAAAATVLLEDALEAERRRGDPPGEVV